VPPAGSISEQPKMETGSRPLFNETADILGNSPPTPEHQKHIGEIEARIRERIGCVGWVRLLNTLPGMGEILGATMHLEIGAVSRFPTPASYAGPVRFFDSHTTHLVAGHSAIPPVFWPFSG